MRHAVRFVRFECAFAVNFPARAICPSGLVAVHRWTDVRDSSARRDDPGGGVAYESMTHGATRARVFHWFVQGGVVRKSDGTTLPVDVDPVVVGRDSGAQVVIDDPEVSALHCELRAVS